MRFIGSNGKYTVVGICLVISLTCASPGWSLSQSDEYFENISVFNDVLSEVQQKYVDESRVKTDELVQSAIRGMLATLDPHSNLMLPTEYDDFREDTRGTFGGLGITIDIRDGWLTVVSPLPETPAFREGILAGDKIIKIEGESTEGMDIKEAVRRLRGEPGTQVTITIYRPSDQTTVDHTLVRDVIHVPNVYAYVIDDNIGYIRLVEFKQTASQDLDEALNALEKYKVDSLILDLRFNSGGLLDMAVEVSNKFLPKGVDIVSIRGRNEKEDRTFVSRSRPRSDLPLVVLVNQASASASEIVAGAIQDLRRGIIVGPAGKRTFGKGSVQTVIPLRDGSALKLTTAKYFTPSGRSIEDDKGILPDIGVEVTEEYQRQVLMKGKIASLPESVGKVQQILPPLSEATLPQPGGEVPSATDSPVAPAQPVPKPTALQPGETPVPEVYDKELAKAVEILKVQRIFAAGNGLSGSKGLMNVDARN